MPHIFNAQLTFLLGQTFEGEIASIHFLVALSDLVDVPAHILPNVSALTFLAHKRS